MAKLLAIGNEENHPDYLFDCPGCGSQHGIWTSKPNNQGAIWDFNGDLEKPTVIPSFNSSAESQGLVLYRCHFFINEGMIQYLSDSTHDLAGQTVVLPEISLAQPLV